MGSRKERLFYNLEYKKGVKLTLDIYLKRNGFQIKKS